MSVDNDLRVKPLPAFPRVTLPDVDDASRALIADAKVAAADAALFSMRRVESLLAKGKHIYPKTVSPKEIRSRRARNKRAKLARRAARA